ncbi:MAG: hypothetical protein J6M30_07725 [Bacteroidales bacterium]|nr:hypothetical protein [Bacteroidales bacterium]
MTELDDASEFIRYFESVHSKKIIRIPYTTKQGVRKTVLMCKCGKTYIGLPYLSVGITENRITDRKTAPFMLFETEEGNIISTSKKKWEIRDTLAHSHYIYSDKLYLRLNIGSADNLMQLYSSDVRRKIRKAIKEGIAVKHGSDKTLIKDFYHVYCVRMKEIGVAPISRSTVAKGVKTGKLTVFVAYKNHTAVGGATLNTVFPSVSANELFATSSKHNKYYVSYLLHFCMMNFAKQQHAQYYSFGRSTRNSSVHNYKKHWKAEEIPLYWSYSNKTKNIRNNKLLYWLWDKLPYFVTKRLGPVVSKYVY